MRLPQDNGLVRVQIINAPLSPSLSASSFLRSSFAPELRRRSFLRRLPGSIAEAAASRKSRWPTCSPCWKMEKTSSKVLNDEERVLSREGERERERERGCIVPAGSLVSLRRIEFFLLLRFFFFCQGFLLITRFKASVRLDAGLFGISQVGFLAIAGILPFLRLFP